MVAAPGASLCDLAEFLHSRSADEAREIFTKEEGPGQLKQKYKGPTSGGFAVPRAAPRESDAASVASQKTTSSQRRVMEVVVDAPKEAPSGRQLRPRSDGVASPSVVTKVGPPSKAASKVASSPSMKSSSSGGKNKPREAPPLKLQTAGNIMTAPSVTKSKSGMSSTTSQMPPPSALSFGGASVRGTSPADTSFVSRSAYGSQAPISASQMSFGVAGDEMGQGSGSFFRTGSMRFPGGDDTAAEYRAFQDSIDNRLREQSPTNDEELPDEERRLKEKIARLEAQLRVVQQDLQHSQLSSHALRYGRVVSQTAMALASRAGGSGVSRASDVSAGPSRVVPGGGGEAAQSGSGGAAGGSRTSRASSRSSRKRRASATSPGMVKKRSRGNEDDEEADGSGESDGSDENDGDYGQ